MSTESYNRFTVYEWRPLWEGGRTREIHRDVASRIFYNWYEVEDSGATPHNGHSFHQGYRLRVSESTQVEVLPIR